MPFDYMLLAAQAAGYAVDIYGSKRQEKFTRIGEQLERQELQLQMQKETLASSEQALYNTERLREIMSSQRALAAARGQLPGVGSNLASQEQSIRLYNADEQARRLSLTFRQHQLESAGRLQKLNKTARNVERRTNRLVKGLNMLNFNEGLLKELTSEKKLNP